MSLSASCIEKLPDVNNKEKVMGMSRLLFLKSQTTGQRWRRAFLLTTSLSSRLILILGINTWAHFMIETTNQTITHQRLNKITKIFPKP